MRYFAIYDKETGYVHRTGSCTHDGDVAAQVLRPDREAIAMLEGETDPNSIRVDVATKTVVQRAI